MIRKIASLRMVAIGYPSSLYFFEFCFQWCYLLEFILAQFILSGYVDLFCLWILLSKLWKLFEVKLYFTYKTIYFHVKKKQNDLLYVVLVWSCTIYASFLKAMRYELCGNCYECIWIPCMFETKYIVNCARIWLPNVEQSVVTEQFRKRQSL
jgi:hypothetical protein